MTQEGLIKKVIEALGLDIDLSLLAVLKRISKVNELA
jgi:hypothetical protein